VGGLKRAALVSGCLCGGNRQPEKQKPGRRAKIPTIAVISITIRVFPK